MSDDVKRLIQQGNAYHESTNPPHAIDQCSQLPCRLAHALDQVMQERDRAYSKVGELAIKLSDLELSFGDARKAAITYYAAMLARDEDLAAARARVAEMEGQNRMLHEDLDHRRLARAEAEQDAGRLRERIRGMRAHCVDALENVQAFRHRDGVHFSHIENAHTELHAAISASEGNAVTGETQATVTAWQWETFPGAAGNADGYYLRMFEEVVELGFALGHSGRELENKILEGVRKVVGDIDDEAMAYACGSAANLAVPGELGDAQILLWGLARCVGVNLQEAVTAKMKINRARKWKIREDGSGHADHVKEGGA